MINKKYFRLIVSIALILFIVLSFFVITLNSQKYNARIFSVGNGWGYEILSGKRILIHQDCIQAIQGNVPFASKKDAMKIANLVILKLEAGKIPYVSDRELVINKINLSSKH